MAEKSPANPSDYLAAERTLLAWIRTGLALMGFGFVVARFGLFLEALQVNQPGLHFRPYGPSFWFGTALIALGVIVNLVCARNHYRLIQELQRGEPRSHGPSWLAIAVALLLAAVGLAMAVYLTVVHQPATEKSMTSQPDYGIVTIPGRHSVDETVAKLNEILKQKEIKLFTWIDHSGAAETAGLQMPSTKVAVFGNPKAGTPLMLAAPGIALDLPLKILIAEDGGGQVWISYNSPAYLQERHGLPPELVGNIAGIEVLARRIAE